MPSIAIFASGTGSNALKIIEHFKDDPKVHVSLIVSNKASAGVLQHAKTYQIPQLIIDRTTFYDSAEILDELALLGVDLIVLAGFLWLVPNYLIKAYPDQIVNIHPALLPKYGGKGMYGMNVHRAVKAAGETRSGITIHYVNEQYDEGQIIFQADCSLSPEDEAADIARKVLELEHRYFAEVLETILDSSDSDEI
ncbi:MAG: phosphoribosylglycinamide formyltransferase [Bacteroidota bacterium]